MPTHREGEQLRGLELAADQRGVLAFAVQHRVVDEGLAHELLLIVVGEGVSVQEQEVLGLAAGHAQGLVEELVGVVGFQQVQAGVVAAGVVVGDGVEVGQQHVDRVVGLAAAVGAGAVAGVDARVELAVLDQRQRGLPGEFQVGREAGAARAVGPGAVELIGAAVLVVEDRPAVDLQRAEALLQGLADFFFDVFLRLGRLSLGQRLLLFQLLLELLDPLLERLDLLQNRGIVGQCAAAEP